MSATRLIHVEPAPCTHAFSAGHPERPAHERGHCLNDCGYALIGSAFEPLGVFCSFECQRAWTARQEPCAACQEVHPGRCLESLP